MNEIWKEIFKELARKLTAGLAFAMLFIFIILQFSDFDKNIIFIIAGVGYLGYFLLEYSRVKQRMVPEKEDVVEIGGGVEESVINSGDSNHITYIVNKHLSRSGVSKEELYEQIKGYLAWAEENFGKITLRGIEQGGRQVVELSLETVYVPLRAEYATKEKDSEFLERELVKREQAESREISLDEVLSLSSRIIITGGPGSGKTTVLQHIAWTLAYAIRHDNTMLCQEKLGLETPLPLPIYVPLSLYANYRANLEENASGSKKTLAAFIADYLLQNQCGLDLDSKFFSNLLRDGKHVLLLLDGLDEVPEEDERILIRQDIEHLVSGKENLRVLVTSRTAAYQGRAVLGRDFQHISVLPIDEKQIAKMIEQAYDAIYPDSASRARAKAKELLDGIKKLEEERQARIGDEAQRLVSTPLMTRMFLIVHFNNRRLPDQRADLYQKAVDAMLRPDYTLDANVSHDIEHRIGGSLALNREMLELLAFKMHQRGKKQGRDIEEETLRKMLEDDPSYTHEIIDDLIRHTYQRGTLLEESGRKYRFIHLSFQEFLTGRYLVEQLRDTEKIADFLESGAIEESWWREPILLMLGYLDITNPRMGREMLIRLGGLSEEAREKQKVLSFEQKLAAFELSAKAYLEAQNQAEDLSEKLKNKGLLFFQKETQTQASFSPKTLSSTANALDNLGYMPDDLNKFIPISNSQAPEFYIAKYPVTNFQYTQFLNADDYTDPKLWQNFPKYDEKQNLLNETWGKEGWEWYQEPKYWNGIREKDEAGKIIPLYWHESRFGNARQTVPAVGVSWYEANAYVQWLLRHWEDEKLGYAKNNPNLQPKLIRLPLESEWEKVTSEKEYAWGDLKVEKEITRFANTSESGISRTTPVWQYVLGTSPSGVMDLSGNVWEWQANYRDDKKNRLSLRGGSWYYIRRGARVAIRDVSDPNDGGYDIGFRLCLLPSL